MLKIYLDIETLPEIGADLTAMAAAVEAPANYKDPEKIAAYKQRHAEEAWRAQALDPWRAFVASITYSIEGEEPLTLIAYGAPNVPDEKEMLQNFERLLQNVHGIRPMDSPHFITFFGNSFDLPILWYRALKYQLPLLASILPHRRYSDQSIDLHDKLLATNWKGKTGGLDNVLRYFGLPQKSGDGSQVLDWWLAGEIDKLREYAIADVQALINLDKTIGDYL